MIMNGGSVQMLPLNHNFSFHKVAMDSYALNWRQRQKCEQSQMNMLMPSGDSDLDSDEDGLIEFANRQEEESSVVVNGNAKKQL